MASVAIQLFDERSSGVSGGVCNQMVVKQPLFAVLECSRKHTNTDLRQPVMIHCCEQSIGSLMFTMALSAIADVCMKGGWPTCEQLSLVRVATDAPRRINAFDRYMAPATVARHKCML